MIGAVATREDFKVLLVGDSENARWPVVYCRDWVRLLTIFVRVLYIYVSTF